MQVNNSMIIIQNAHEEWKQNQQTGTWGNQIGVIVNLLQSEASNAQIAHFLAEYGLQASKGAHESKSINQAVLLSDRERNYKKFCESEFNFTGLKPLPREVINIILYPGKTNLKDMFSLCQVDKQAGAMVQ